MAKAKTKISKGLIPHSLENVSGEVFTHYPEAITKLVERRSGVYALYNGGELYYIGKAADLRRRVKHHLRDRHNSKWTHFSFYVVSNDRHISPLESLLICIAQPEGNRVRPRDVMRGDMRKELRNLIIQQQAGLLNGLVPEKRGKLEKKKVKERDLVGLVPKRTIIRREYKGVVHKAILNPKGTIRYQGQTFESLSAAARKVLKGRHSNGWTFWYIRNSKGEWVKINRYK